MVKSILPLDNKSLLTSGLHEEFNLIKTYNNFKLVSIIIWTEILKKI